MSEYTPKYKPAFTNPYLMFNPVTLTDYYNGSHQRLKIDTDFEVSHIYNRRAYRGSGMVIYGLHDIVFNLFKLQFTKNMVDDARHYYESMGAKFPYDMWMGVVEECGGYLPLHVQMLPEGSYAPVGTPFAQVRNTKRDYGELVTWFEGDLLHMWGGAAPATEALHIRNYLESLVPKYGDFIRAKAHSFGFRGHSSILTAFKTSAAWNLFLFGSDDVIGTPFTPGAKVASIPASAHKVTQQFDNELESAFHAVYAVANDEKIIAMPIDTYDAWYFIGNYVKPILEYAKNKGVHVVFRPDSGETFESLFDQVIAIHRIVSANGFTNGTCIVGENMSLDNMVRGDKYLESNGVPASFCFNGIGGKFYNQFNRDTHGLAMKTAFSNGSDRMKLVNTDPFKQSIPGIVALRYDENGDLTVYADDNNSLYQTVYHYDPDNDKFPFMVKPDWSRTHELAQDLIGAKLQDRIKLSAGIETKIDMFNIRYGHGK